MSPDRSCWRRAAAGVVAFVCAATALGVRAETLPVVPSLSGTAYLDTNGNRAIDSSDWAIKGAKITLLDESDPSFLLATFTDKCGRYVFDGPAPGDHSGLPSGVYTIRMDTQNGAAGYYSSTPTLVTLATNYAVAYQPPNPGTWDNGHSYEHIELWPAMSGVAYNFGTSLYPLELISKKMLITTVDPGQPVVPEEPPVVPEPGTWALLIAGALGLCGGRFFRRRRKV